jgi:hypothetical protein
LFLELQQLSSEATEIFRALRKNLRFFAGCAAKKWPCGQPAISFQQSAISLKSGTD